MGYTIAVCGKGGTGKTTIASLIINWLAEHKKGKILGVDADPNFNLAANLGLEVKENIGQIVDEIAKNPSIVSKGMSKNEYIDYRIQTNLLESEGFDVLVMGRPEGPGCYCYVNNLLRGIVKKLIDNYNYVVIDNEAGLEHLSRRTTRAADSVLIISDDTVVGLRSAKRIDNLIKELEIKAKKSFLILNRANQDSLDKKELKDLGLEYLDSIPQDKEILALSLKGKPLTDLTNGSLALKSIERICKKLWQ